ncbi:MAG TPA: Ppx/GppA family phosphatase, partial [Allosphingosinicella sp.]
ATAAVREASDCDIFLAKVRQIGFEPVVLSGKEEGVMAGQGVLSAIPGADGIVGDLGGGSLELVDLSGGKVAESVSLPLGVLRIAGRSEPSLAKKVAKAIDATDFARRGRKRPFYLVGGSWRALARLDMLLNDYPLPITQQYRMHSGRPAELQRAIDGLDKTDLRSIPSLSVSRIPTLPHANLLLKNLVEALRPSELIVSSFGIREGLLFSDLPARTRARDPLLEAVREAGGVLGRFGEHGALLDRWIDPIFEDEADAARLRLAACLLADVAWQAHPDFRAERGVDMALHGNWVGIDAPGRVMVAQALFCNFGGGREFEQSDVAALCTPAQLRHACHWGLAMRLGQRLSGGAAAALQRSRLLLRGEMLRLELKAGDEAIYGETVQRRLKTLAAAFGRGMEAVAV